ncbi:hypothetical protein PoB_003937400 [Plakobranchus ocellatus]|uniref:Uncharacterized protein n=1 Tax=Plakobranchus ocellatus TaxID=259542 RepID=A0AAV4B3C2_9GAST|nr:hypothetical protein PoB_003937400 [Plakobranchus ocellatus]
MSDGLLHRLNRQTFPIQTGLRSTINFTIRTASASATFPAMPPGCNYPKQQALPPHPITNPVPATEENRRGKLERWVLNHFKSSTFNTCVHQTLPMMSGPPMKLMVDPNAKPVAHHTPIPVATHQQEEVKAGLEQDGQLDVIEPVPVSTPVIWLCALKNEANRGAR